MASADQVNTAIEPNHCTSFSDILEAQKIVKSYAHYTPLVTCSTIDKMCGRNLFLKCENFQKTGSFKFRGAVNAINDAMQLAEDKKPLCVVTHSSGNHGQAVAKAAQMFGVPAYIIMPNNSPQCKKDAVKGYGGVVIECEPSDQSRIEAAGKVCAKNNGTLIHSSQAPAVIAGQGTMALEMLEQNPNLDIIVAPVGGGGMISGIAITAKRLKPSIKIYAAEPELANDCYLSKKNGYRVRQTEYSNTIADGVKTAIGESTWPIIRDLVDDVITVSEDEIKRATKLVWERAKLVIEPTTGVGVAAVLSDKFATAKNNADELKKVGVVLCGGNADLSVVSKILSGVM